MKKFSLNNLKIRTKFLLIYCFCVLLPIIFTDAFILFTVNQNARKDQMNNLINLMERVKSNLEDTVEGCILFTYNFRTDENLNDFLTKDYINYLDYYENYTTLLSNNSLSYNFNYGLLYKIVVYADNNSIVNGGKIISLDTVRTTDWYKAFKESGKDTFLYSYFDGSKRFIPGSGTCRTISIIRDMDYYSNRGIEKFVKIDIDYNYMLKDVLNEKFDGEIYVRNKDYILFSNLPSTSGLTDFTPANQIYDKSATMSMTFQTGYEDWEILIFSDDIPFWSVLVEYNGLILLILFNLLIPTLLIYLVGKSISRRLAVITEYMGRVEKERFEVIDSREGMDEIGKLIRSYNLMVLKIKELIEVVFKGNAEKQALELSKKQAELKAVQSQVNPHFLFNTLESIRMRSLIKNETETADIIGELAVLFRKSMIWGADNITIEEEMSFIDKYINIHKYRFGDKIRYYRYVMPDCRNYLIPKLSIGTFIENACIHGIETTDKDGVISITVTKNDNNLYIEISDNGKGFEERRLEELRSMLAHADHKILYESKSTGMLNAYLRLKMFCDGNIVFDIDSEPESGTDIMIQLPLIYVDNTIFKKTRDIKGEVSDDQSNDS